MFSPGEFRLCGFLNVVGSIADSGADIPRGIKKSEQTILIVAAEEYVLKKLS